VIANNGYAGVVLLDAGAGNMVEGNAIDGNGNSQPTAGRGDGVFIMSTSNATVSNNSIASNRDWGIFVDDSSSIVVTGNTYQGNGLGTKHTS
jgi:parallel beta-helix repeat protein